MASGSAEGRVRAFVAVDVNDALRREVAALRASLSNHAPGAKWVDPTLCHITLRFLGWVSQSAVADIGRACGQAAQHAKPFSITFAGVGAFPSWRRPSVLWLGIDSGSKPLHELQQTVENALVGAGSPREDRPFSPHLTLARFKRPPSPSVAARLEQASQPAAQRGFTTVEIGSVQLMRSDLGPRGPAYTVMDSWRLGG